MQVVENNEVPTNVQTEQRKGYSGEEKFEITGDEFVKIIEGLVQGINNCKIEKHTIKHKYIDEKGEDVKNPTKRQIDLGRVRKVFDVENTFKDVVIEYNATKLHPAMLIAQSVINEINQRNIDNGVVSF